MRDSDGDGADPARRNRPLKFRIDLRNPCASAEPAAVRDMRIKVYVAADSSPPGQLTEVELRGRVRSALAVGARSVDLGRIPPGIPAKTRVVPIRSLMQLRDLTATADDTVVRVEVVATGMGMWDVRVTSGGNPPTGNYKSIIRLRPVLMTGEHPPAVSMPVEFELLGDVQPDSAAVTLGAHSVGSVAEGRLTLRSLSGRNFSVETWTAEPAGSVNVTAGDIDGGSRCFTMRQQVGVAGDQTARVRFTGKDADARVFESMVEVRCYGIESPK